VNGKEPLPIRWRDVPQPFGDYIDPTDPRHDGLGDLEKE
jgi:hypothetical protein